METIIPIAQIIIAVVLIGLILMQQRGTGLGSSFGGGDSVYSTQRGMQKKIYWATVVLGAIFIGLAVFSLFQS